ncbi:hypothetical protein [Actinophytocola xinjiangensis]|nr:hypothetical protein [Actinophytocola xinjiangensis]
MDGSLDLRGESISQSGGALTGSAQGMAGDLSAFTSSLSGYGNPFGDDDLGSVMQMIYSAVSEAAMECFDGNTAELGVAGGQLVEMGSEYLNTEQTNEAEFTTLRGEVGG